VNELTFLLFLILMWYSILIRRHLVEFLNFAFFLLHC